MDDNGSDRHDDAPLTATDTSLVVVLESFRQAGWSANHTAVDEAHIRCGDCRTVSEAASIQIEARHRTEGASDPQDMLSVFGIACPACDSKGAIVVGYGPAASAQDDELMVALGDADDAVDPVAHDPT